MQKTIVTILSTNFAGSHFLSLLLGSHSQASHIGELRRVVEGRGKALEVSFCHLCDPSSNCPTVRGLKGISAAATYGKVFANFADLGQQPQMLVDASKRVAWARLFVNQSDYKFKYIHLIRDPRAIVRREMLNHSTWMSRWHIRRQAVVRGPKFRPGLLMAPTWKVALTKWYDQNSEITNFLQRQRRDALVVTYRDLATDTVGELRRIDEWMGLPFEPLQVEHWRFEHHGSQKWNYDWVKEQKKTGYFDLRWKEFFTPEVAAAITRDDDVTELLGRLSLQHDELGLTRTSSDAKSSPTKAA